MQQKGDFLSLRKQIEAQRIALGFFRARPSGARSCKDLHEKRFRGENLCMTTLSLPLPQGFSTLHDIDAFRCYVAEISDNLAGGK